MTTQAEMTFTSVKKPRLVAFTSRKLDLIIFFIITVCLQHDDNSELQNSNFANFVHVSYIGLKAT